MSIEDLAGRVALVTGGSGGIGRELSRQLGRAGVSVAVHYRAGAEAAESVEAEITAAGGRAEVFQADLSDAEAPAALIDAVRASLGPIDILLANAGLGRRGTLEDIDAAAFDETLAVNLRAPYLLARHAIPEMRERGFGRILFTSSIAALTGGIVGPHYTASKSGLHGLTHYLASRLAADGVTVNAIAPALIEDTAMLPGDPGELAARLPVRRLGRPAEVAELVMALISNAFVTNQVVSIDGGLHPR